MSDAATPSLEALLDRATEAACAAVWSSLYDEVGLFWPSDCPDPELFRREEKEALLPALRVLMEEGALGPEWAGTLDRGGDR